MLLLRPKGMIKLEHIMFEAMLNPNTYNDTGTQQKIFQVIRLPLLPEGLLCQPSEIALTIVVITMPSISDGASKIPFG